MQLALALGRRGLGNTWPNPAVGAVVVKDGDGHRPRLDAAGRPAACRDRGAQARRRGRAKAQRSTSRSSPARITARRRPAPTPSSPPASRAWCRRWRIPIRKSPGRGTSGCARPASRSMIGVGAEEARARACRPYPPHPRRPSACHAQACGLRRRQGRAGRPPAVPDHRRDRARARASAAGHERRHPGRHRHRAGRRSGADLPAAGLAASARRCAWCWTAN